MAGHEPREDIIQLMMKRLGVQKSTLVLRDFYFNSVYCFLCSIVFTFIVWIVTLKENMGLGVFFLFVLLNQIQSLVRTNLIGNVMKPSLVPMVVAVYLLFQVSISYTLLQPIPPPGMSVIACIISPMMQLQLVLQFAFALLPLDKKLTFSEFTTEVFPDLTVATIFAVAICMTIFWILLTLYLWPLYIEVDAENPRRWYYPFQPSFWCRSGDQ